MILERLFESRRLIYAKANPLNTYLSTKPSFASPQPLAAASGLTIPLKITLSEIKLSAFIILVFSRQKGLTLVFRNDPLESLKVSSTFDSIPFVREYLQKEIEGQLRTLLMDDVPAIIHRLSLRLWVPEYRSQEEQDLARTAENTTSGQKLVDPLASPPQDAMDYTENTLDASQISSMSLDFGSENHSVFSQKNLLRLAALTDSHRTLSLFTPNMRDVVFRAWAGPSERGEIHGSHTPITPLHPGISRKNSTMADTSTTYTFSDPSEAGSHFIRPPLTSYGSSFTGTTLGSNKHGKAARKRKHRVVNLRKAKTDLDDNASISGESTFSASSISATASSAASEAGFVHRIPAQREGELITPPTSPQSKSRFYGSPDSIDLGDSSPKMRDVTPRPPARHLSKASESTSAGLSVPPALGDHQRPSDIPIRPRLRPLSHSQYPAEKSKAAPSSSSSSIPPQRMLSSPYPSLETSPSSILEQAWLVRMAGELARRAQDEKTADRGFGERNEQDETPPPAYGS